MKTVVLSVAVVLTSSLSAQAPKRDPAPAKASQPSSVRIGPHLLGESFSQWLVIEKIDLDAECSNPSPPSLFDQSLGGHQLSVEEITNTTLAERRHHEAVQICEGLTPVRGSGSGHWHDLRGLPADADVGNQWTFMGGKLAGQQNVYSTDIAAKELGFLKEAYGLPASIVKKPQQNAFGAKWNDTLITWRLPGGAVLYMDAHGGPDDDLTVTFMSKELATAPVPREPNPYLAPTK